MLFWKKHKMKKEFRELRGLLKHTLWNDDDILPEEKKTSLRELYHEIRTEGALPADVKEAEKLLDSWNKRFSRLIDRNSFAASMRGFLDVLLVACCVAGGIRGLFLQPFKIPTGSMQPTLFGIHYIDRKESEKYTSGITRLTRELFAERVFLKAEEAGKIDFENMTRFTEKLFFPKTSLQIGSRQYTLPGDFFANIWRYLPKKQPVLEKGEILCDGYLSSGDHVFVERLSIHFREFKRGDVIVFNTVGLKSPTQDLAGYYYIKRLAGLPGDTLKIVDNILLIKPRGEEKFIPAYEIAAPFRKLYTFQGGYMGHYGDGLLASGQEVTVPEKHYFALGDNTYNSLDSRNWGFIPRKNMIGLAVNIFWPISRRWGLVDTREPLDTESPVFHDLRKQPPAMRLQ